MNETLSDIFSENDQQYGYDTDCAGNEGETIQKLKEQVESLQKEKTSLLAQFEGTLTITSQIESINSELVKVKNINRQLSAENEDLSHRLELSIQSKNELVQKVEEEQKINVQARSESYLNNRQEVEKQKAFYQKQLDEANDKIEQLMSQVESNEVASKLAEGKIDRLLQNSQRFFNQEFLSFDDLSDFLSHPGQVAQNDAPMQQQHQQQQQPQQQVVDRMLPPQANDDRVAEMAMKLRSMKTKVKELANANRSLEENANQLNYRNNELAKNQKLINSEYEAKIAAQQNEMSAKTIELNNIRTDNESLKLQVEKAQIAIKNFEEQIAQKPQVVVQKIVDTKKVDELREAFVAEKEKLMFENATLTQKCNSTTSKINELTSKLTAATNEIDSLKQISEKQKNEIIALTAVSENAVRDADSLRLALHQKQPKVEQNPQPKPLISKAELAKLKEQNETQKQEIISLHVEQSKNLATIDEQRIKINDLKQLMTSVEEQSKQTLMDLNELKTKLHKKPTLKTEDLLPADSWRTNDFGSQVGEDINYIANNSSLQPISKLHSIYSIIRTYHLNQLSELDETNTSLARELQNLQTMYGKFLVDVSVALSDRAFTIDDFHQSGGESIVSEISTLRSNYDNMKHVFDSMKSTLNDIITFLNLPEYVSSNDVIQTIASFMRELEDKANQLNETKKQYKLLKASYKEAAQKSQTREIELVNAKEEAQNYHNELAETNDKIAKELTEAKKLNESLVQQNNKIKGELNLLNSSFNKEVETRLSQLKMESEKLSKELQVQLDAANETILHNEKTIRDNDDKTKVLQQKIGDLSNDKSSLTIELSATKIAMEENAKELEEKFESEKLLIKQQFDTAVAQLKKQCENQAEDLFKFAEANSSLETKMLRIKSAYSKMQTEKRKAEADYKFALEQFERDRRLIEAQSRSKIIMAENSFNSRLEEMQIQRENDQRRIFTFTAEKFKKFFNPGSQFNERNFRALVEQVKEEFSRLSIIDEHIRRMLGVNEKQSTEDAVAVLLLH